MTQMKKDIITIVTFDKRLYNLDEPTPPDVKANFIMENTIRTVIYNDHNPNIFYDSEFAIVKGCIPEYEIVEYNVSNFKDDDILDFNLQLIKSKIMLVEDTYFHVPLIVKLSKTFRRDSIDMNSFELSASGFINLKDGTKADTIGEYLDKYVDGKSTESVAFDYIPRPVNYPDISFVVGTEPSLKAFKVCNFKYVSVIDETVLMSNIEVYSKRIKAINKSFEGFIITPGQLDIKYWNTDDVSMVHVNFNKEFVDWYDTVKSIIPKYKIILHLSFYSSYVVEHIIDWLSDNHSSVVYIERSTYNKNNKLAKTIYELVTPIAVAIVFKQNPTDIESFNVTNDDDDE